MTSKGERKPTRLSQAETLIACLNDDWVGRYNAAVEKAHADYHDNPASRDTELELIAIRFQYDGVLPEDKRIG